jgi:ArsR family transcriptional regulator
MLFYEMMKQSSAKTDLPKPTCSDADHVPPVRPEPAPAALDRAARLFRAMGDSPRLRILDYLSRGECCVTELVAQMGEKFPTVSQRLRVLRSEGLVSRRRVGTHVYYALADSHVAHLVANALEHAGELEVTEPDTQD